MCDVILKGGITSGVVYPYTVCELAGTYRLRNVGGTSAGAIAAAAAAAAEYGREQGGYDVLAALPQWLGGNGHLKGLFQPAKSTRGLYALVLSGVKHRSRSRPLWLLATAVRRFPFSALLGAAPGIAVLVIAVRDAAGTLQIVAAVAGGVLALLGLVIALAVRVTQKALRAIPANRFGMCSGMPGPKSNDPALTPWLHERIEAAAGGGRDRPLTFADLWAGPDAVPDAADPKDAWLRLEMMTTNVTNHRAERLPSASSEYAFDPDDFRALFPEAVVQWMIDNPPPLSTQPARRRDQEMRRELLLPRRPMPHPADVPVIVATRMSLSFPVLLSAVPLWRVDYTLDANQDAIGKWRQWLGQHPDDWRDLLTAGGPGLPDVRPEAERCWFSDGGIASNFPVHFFDALLPRHPTFAINLRPFHPNNAPPEGQDPAPDQQEHVWMPDSHRQGILDWWYRFDGELPGFLSQIVRTMQNRVDDTQLGMPGYRDRVVHVSMTSREGGMNLDMEPAVIERLTERGRWAGRKLVARFAQPPPEPNALSWEDHKWVRLRTSLAATTEMLQQLAHGYAAAPLGDDRTYAELLARDPGAHPTSYNVTVGQRAIAERLNGQIADLVAELDVDDQTLAKGAPSPPPGLRMVPQDAPLRARGVEE